MESETTSELSRELIERLYRLEGSPSPGETRAAWESLLDEWPAGLIETVSDICNSLNLPERHVITQWREDNRGFMQQQGVPGWDPDEHTALQPAPERPEPVETDYSDKIGQIFQSKKRLREMWDRYQYRPEQERYSERVGAAQRSGEVAVLEAGTGIGKSLGYLIPSALLALEGRGPVVISCNTINLQEQLLEVDVPKVLRLFEGTGLRVELIKGRDHYFCNHRMDELAQTRDWPKLLQRAAERFELDPDDRLRRSLGRFLVHLLVWLRHSESGDLGELSWSAGLDRELVDWLKYQFNAKYSTCLLDRCPQRSQCYFYRSRERANKAHLAVVNHALFFSLHQPGEEGGSVCDQAPHVVFDEAHHLEDVICNQRRVAISSRTTSDFLQRLNRWRNEPVLRSVVSSSSGEEADRIDAWLEECDARLERASRNLKQLDLFCSGKAGQFSSDSYEADLDIPEGREQQLVDDFIPRLEDVLGALLPLGRPLEDFRTYLLDRPESTLHVDDDQFAVETGELVSRWQEIEELTARLELKAGSELETETLAGEFANWLTLRDRRNNTWSVTSSPVDASQIFSRLAEEKSSVLLTSATLSTGGDFSYLDSRLGLDELDSTRLVHDRFPSPFDYENRSMLAVVTDVSEPDWGEERSSYQRDLARALVRISRTAGGGVLGLFSNYLDLNAVHDAVRSELDGFDIFCQGVHGSRSSILREFRESERGVLLGTASFWEGIDVVGEGLRCVVLTKLPFPNFNRPVLRHRNRRVEEEGKNPFMELSLPQAVLRFVQGFGRLIRSEQDYGVCTVLDPRIVTKRGLYGKHFLRSLPGPELVDGPLEDTLGEIEDFLGRFRK